MKVHKPIFAVVVVALAFWSGCTKPGGHPIADPPELKGRTLQSMTAELGSPVETLEYTIGNAPTKGWQHGVFSTSARRWPNALTPYYQDM